MAGISSKNFNSESVAGAHLGLVNRPKRSLPNSCREITSRFLYVPVKTPTQLTKHTCTVIRMEKRTYIQYAYPYEYLGIPQAETTVFFLRASSHMGMLLHSELRGESWPRLESDSAALAAAIL